MKTLKTFLITAMVIHCAIYATSQENLDLTNDYSVIETGNTTDIPDTQNAFIMPLMTQDKSRSAYQSVSFRPYSIYLNDWPKSSSAVSIYFSFLGTISILNGGYEWMHHWNPYFHSGFTAGLTYTSGLLIQPVNLGAHFAFIIFTGGVKNHFEFRLGGVYNFVEYLDSSDLSSDFISFKYVPVISIGYRYQPPGKSTYFRVALSTAGLGIGGGFVIASNSSQSSSYSEDFSF